MGPRNIGRMAKLVALQRQIERWSASAEKFERASDSLGPGSDLKAILPVVIQFDTDDLVLRAIVRALMDRN